jgi:hypothetical protein
VYVACFSLYSDSNFIMYAYSEVSVECSLGEGAILSSNVENVTLKFC